MGNTDTIFIVMKKENHSSNMFNIVNSIYNLFIVRYCVSTNKKRISLILYYRTIIISQRYQI